MSVAGNTSCLPHLRNKRTLQKQANQALTQLTYARVGRGRKSRTRQIARSWVLAITLLLCLGLFDPTTGYARANSAALSSCVNSVAGGVYLDTNGNSLHERSEPFLAGIIQVVNSASDIADSIESTDGLFVLDDLACDDYAVYHDGDYVGKITIRQAMGQTLIELPKTNFTRHIFVPLIMR